MKGNKYLNLTFKLVTVLTELVTNNQFGLGMEEGCVNYVFLTHKLLTFLNKPWNL